MAMLRSRPSALHTFLLVLVPARARAGDPGSNHALGIDVPATLANLRYQEALDW